MDLDGCGKYVGNYRHLVACKVIHRKAGILAVFLLRVFLLPKVLAFFYMNTLPNGYIQQVCDQSLRVFTFITSARS